MPLFTSASKGNETIMFSSDDLLQSRILYSHPRIILCRQPFILWKRYTENCARRKALDLSLVLHQVNTTDTFRLVRLSNAIQRY